MDRWIPESEATSLPALFAARVNATPDADAYRYFDRDNRVWRTLSWRGMSERAARWQAALRALKLEPGDRVAILLKNGPDWIAVDQAALGLGLIPVGLFCEDTDANTAAILRDAEPAVLVVERGEWWLRLQQELGRVQGMTVLVARHARGMKPPARAAAELLPDRPEAFEVRDIDSESTAAVIYTSGTTGRARGAVLTHRNLLWNAYACARAVKLEGEEHLIAFMPLSHAFERTVDYYRGLITGACIAFCRNPRFLLTDLARERPTAIVGVPQLYERIYTELRHRMQHSSNAVRRLVHITIEIGWSVFEHEQGRAPSRMRHMLWPLLRRFVASRLLAPLGGRLEVAISGAAALPQPVARTLIGLGLDVLQGYGLTEAGPVVSVNRRDDNDPQSVGLLLEGVGTRVGPDNELLVRSPGVMRGYWRDEAATQAVLDPAGWLKTGDKVSRLDKDRLYLTGRVKEVIVMTSGEKASPEPIEQIMGLDPLVNRAVVVGEARPFLAAVLNCDAQRLAALMEDLGLDPHRPEGLRSPRLERHLLRRVTRLLHDYPGYAKIRRLFVTTDEWTAENGLLTGSGKVRRRQVARRYRKEIDRIYGHRPLPGKTDFSYNVNLG